MARYEVNEERNRVEIYFDGVHDIETSDRMKAIHFRWNHNKVCC
jgi:hypothetical protein